MKTQVPVEVGVEASVSWGDMVGLEDGVLSLVEGEEREVVCEARGAYPAPTFSWTSEGPLMKGSEGDGIGSEGAKRNSRSGMMAERSVGQQLPEEQEGAVPLNRTTKVGWIWIP